MNTLGYKYVGFGNKIANQVIRESQQKAHPKNETTSGTFVMAFVYSGTSLNSSNVSLQLTKSGRGLFSGYLDKRVPKTGNIKKAGYCNINTLRARKSFKREGYYDWHPYNHLVMRVRGDGRSYMLNISTAGYFDITWNDVYHYALYTRGGPYWQYVKIPFSKFFMASKGRIQDHQEPLPLHNVVSFGITAADKVTGPFNLEIDYIGLLFDPSHKEECAYEMYKTDDYIAGY
ncbi:complex I intermediate-associated protein 30, mitochondrial isoform X2 [Neodiprion virginianus]|uniref:complex I intermediate-associated protein 30, mitochondrial isoform X2 n=1 Tax=Neodiprion fabricii TaxID=2872261 RepID=UPI001ED95A23|nr:complex I intermediate-associated protein 30, mitochondrial isoform X2 [Neodiprion fabricii]XP_046628535.1 complex I intermediate-associated protein 30, mitochondrial isoform X2 [Neodiprion virginianus]